MCPSVDEWIRMWYIYTMEYYSAIRRKQILPFATTWMELGGIMVSEISQVEQDKHHMISLICGVQQQSKNCRNKRAADSQNPRMD